MVKFGRLWALYIGVNTELSEKNVPKDKVVKVVADGAMDSSGRPATDYTTIPENAVVFTNGLKMEADITQNKKGTDKTHITLYNVDPHTVAKFKRDATVILKAGYEQDLSLGNDELKTGYASLPTLYCGQIHSIKTQSKPPDVITKIFLSDGSTPRRNIKISKSWPPNTSNSQIVQDLVEETRKSGVPTGSVRMYPDDPHTKGSIDNINWGGYSASGNLYEELEKVTRANGLELYHAQGKLYVSHALRSTGRETYLIEAENIIGDVTQSLDTETDESNEEGGSDSTITVEVWLDTRPTVDMNITLKGTDFDGDYRVKHLNHSLDSRGNNWTTKITATKG